MAFPKSVVIPRDGIIAWCEGWQVKALLLLAGSLLVGPIAASGNAWAWGDEGHRIICEIAMRLAVPSTRAEIQRLIDTDTEFDFFSDACTWPDHPRKRAAEHFVNLPRDSSGFTSDICPSA